MISATIMSSFFSSRRKFLKQAGGTALAFQVVPSRVFGANERLSVGCIGIGGKGAGDVKDIAAAGADIVALCDVDERRRGKNMAERFPKAPFHKDFRRMLEKEGKHLDAVSVSTPDHLHCHAAVWAMRMGKHVYVQKPMAHSVWEARYMTQVAKEQGVATQMGNQAHANEPIRRAVELIRAGIIGKVKEVHTWTNRPIWPQGITEMPKAQPIPNSLDWYLWLGPAPDRPYHESYCPFKWRGWWDFGTGALGDMGCHIMDMPFWALDLKHPTSVEAKTNGSTEFGGPKAATITYRFPAGQYSHELDFCWYDGNKKDRQMPPVSVFEGTDFNSESAKKLDCLLIGDKGKFLFQRGTTRWFVYPKNRLEEFKDTPETIPRVPNEDAEWVEACKGGPAALSHFDHSGPFTETVLLGNLAIRTGKKIEWDGPNMKATNAPEVSELIQRPYRAGWEL
jgi:predicted dehydrogenase